MTAPQDPFATPSDPFARPGDAAQQPGGHGQQPGYGQQPGSYGQPPYGTAPSGHTGPKKNGLGVAALVLGILSLLSWFFLIGGLFGLVAIILGVLGRGRVKRGEADNGGIALAGILTGALGLLLTILVIAGVAALFGSGEFSNLTECLREAGGDQAAIDECSRQFEDSVSG